MKYLKISSALFLLLVVGLGSSTLLGSFGVVQGSADVLKPVSISEVYYESSIGYDSGGEYVLLDVNADILDLSNWNLTSLTDGEGENAINYSGRVRTEHIVLVDDSSTITDPGEGWLVFDVGTFPNSGLDNGGEALRLGYIPSGNIEISSANYTGTSCAEDQAYNVSSGKCDSMELQISGGGS